MRIIQLTLIPTQMRIIQLTLIPTQKRLFLQDEDHEEQEEEDLAHDPEVLNGPPPVAQGPVRVGHDDGQEGRERPGKKKQHGFNH